MNSFQKALLRGGVFDVFRRRKFGVSLEILHTNATDCHEGPVYSRVGIVAWDWYQHRGMFLIC